MSNENAQEQPEQPTVANKLYVGNLSYETTEEELSAFFAGHKTVSVEIKMRRSRPTADDETPVLKSAGHGFVTFESEEAANKALAAKSGSELAGRELIVTFARPPQARSARRGRGRGRGGRSQSTRNEASGEQEQDDENEAPTNRRGRGGRRGGRSQRSDGDQSKATEQSGEKPVRDTEKTVYISNLPFSMDSDALAEHFKNLGFGVAKATVASVRRYRGPPRSKGFGFVEFQTKEDQGRAVEEVSGKTIGEREVSVKIALPRPEEPVSEA